MDGSPMFVPPSQEIRRSWDLEREKQKRSIDLFYDVLEVLNKEINQQITNHFYQFKDDGYLIFDVFPVTLIKKEEVYDYYKYHKEDVLFVLKQNINKAEYRCKIIESTDIFREHSLTITIFDKGLEKLIDYYRKNYMFNWIMYKLTRNEKFLNKDFIDRDGN